MRNSDEARLVTYLKRSADEEILVAINFSNRPWTGLVEIGGEAFKEITPQVAPPLRPGEAATERAAAMRPAALPALALDGWGYRIFQRSLK